MSEGGGKNKIASLVNLAKNRKKAESSPETESFDNDERLDLELDDPTRPQQTPPELETPYEEPFEIKSEHENEGKKEGFLSRFTMSQRIILMGVIAVAVFGAQSMTSNDRLDYLEPESATHDHAASSSAQTKDGLGAQSETAGAPTSDGFEPIDQGNIAPDTNSINLTGNPEPESAASEFSMDPLDPGSEASGAEVTVSEEEAFPVPEETPSFGGSDVETSGQNLAQMPENMPGDSMQASFTDENVSSQQEPATDDNFGGFEPEPPTPTAPVDSAAIDSVENKISDLNEKFTSLQQSVRSIKSDVQLTASSNKDLTKSVERLMAELEEREQKLQDLRDRPNITDLVIFRAASSCATCVPHALFNWGGKDIEVGDGLKWQGFDVAIRGDRLTLRKDGEDFHYWYR